MAGIFVSEFSQIHPDKLPYKYFSAVQSLTCQSVSFGEKEAELQTGFKALTQWMRNVQSKLFTPAATERCESHR